MFQIEKVHKSHSATALFPAIYSLTPISSPNGEGREYYHLYSS